MLMPAIQYLAMVAFGGLQKSDREPQGWGQDLAANGNLNRSPTDTRESSGESSTDEVVWWVGGSSLSNRRPDAHRQARAGRGDRKRTCQSERRDPCCFSAGRCECT